MSESYKNCLLGFKRHNKCSILLQHMEEFILIYQGVHHCIKVCYFHLDTSPIKNVSTEYLEQDVTCLNDCVFIKTIILSSQVVSLPLQSVIHPEDSSL